MTSTKYIGYVGGAAIAVGVGAAIAAAGEGTANADTGHHSTTKEHSADHAPANRGPQKKVGHPLKKVGKTVESVAKTVTGSLHKPVTKAAAKPTAASFEAKQVERLKNMFAAKPVSVTKPAALQTKLVSKTVTRKPVEAESTTVATTTSTTQKQAATSDTSAWDPNPLRATDPAPHGVPDEIVTLRDGLMDVTPTELKPVTREVVEGAYRVSQMVPWVNVVVPITKIAPSLATAIQGDDAGLQARQTIINQLILTTPPGSFLYYGYDEVADLLNQEEPAQQLKETAFTTVWDLLDPLQLAHKTGEPGI